MTSELRRPPLPAVCGQIQRPVSESARMRRTARVLLDAYDVFDAAASAVSQELAVVPTRVVVGRLSESQVRAVATALAVEAVWVMPVALSGDVRTVGERRVRLWEVRQWCEGRRARAWRLLERTWVR